MRRFFVHFKESQTDNLNSKYVDSQHIDKQYKESHLSLNSLSIASTLTLPDDIYHHWCRVLRANVGEQSLLFDGLGGETLVELVEITKKQAIVKVITHIDIDRSARHFSTIAIVMSRGDRMDYVIQKSTELGATCVQLLTSQHGEVRLKSQQVDKKLAHWQQVALSACEQCGLNRPPLVLSPLSLESWIQGDNGDTSSDIQYLVQDSFYQTYLATMPLKLILAVPDKAESGNVDTTQSINNYIDSRACGVARFDILIGAEGGLTDEEYQLSRSNDFVPWQIGNRVLRTETAPVVALSLLNFSSFQKIV